MPNSCCTNLIKLILNCFNSYLWSFISVGFLGTQSRCNGLVNDWSWICLSAIGSRLFISMWINGFFIIKATCLFKDVWKSIHIRLLLSSWSYIILFGVISPSWKFELVLICSICILDLPACFILQCCSLIWVFSSREDTLRCKFCRLVNVQIIWLLPFTISISCSLTSISLANILLLLNPLLNRELLIGRLAFIKVFIVSALFLALVDWVLQQSQISVIQSIGHLIDILHLVFMCCRDSNLVSANSIGNRVIRHIHLIVRVLTVHISISYHLFGLFLAESLLGRS